MDTLNQIAQDILGIIRAKRVDDYNVTAAQVKRWINDYRSVLIRNELNKNRAIDEDFVQDLGCVELEQVKNADCGPGCMVLRTCKIIPAPVITKLGLSITRVGPVKRTSRAFTFVDYNEITWAGNGRFADGQVFAYYLNGYIYLELKVASKLARGLKFINIRGVFENPEEVQDYKGCDGTPCYGDGTPYPVKKWMKNSIIDLVLERRFGITERSITDNINDEADAKEI